MNTNKSVIKIIVAILLTTVIFILAKSVNKNLPDNQNSDSKSAREKAIEDIMSKNESVWNKEAKIFGDSKNLLVFTGYADDPKNHPEEDSIELSSRAGIIAFRFSQNKLSEVWESLEPMSGVGKPGIKFDDLNFDRYPEVLVSFIQSKYNENLYIYRYNPKLGNFSLISPIESQLGGGLISSLYGDLEGIKIIDIDGDNIKEVIITNSLNIEDMSQPIERKKQIYKFNGEAYKLWKEEKVKR